MCGTCPYQKTGASFLCINVARLYVYGNVSCKSKIPLYCITCNNCGEDYKGSLVFALKCGDSWSILTCTKILNGLFFVRWYVEFCLQVVKLSYIKLICNILGITPFYAKHLLKQNLYFKWKGFKSIGVLTNCQCIHVRNKLCLADQIIMKSSGMHSSPECLNTYTRKLFLLIAVHFSVNTTLFDPF